MGTLTTLQVLAEPSRQAILDLLRDGELPVGELVARLNMSQPAISKHLRVLKEAGMVDVRADAQRRLYRIRPEPLAELDDWLASYRKLWFPCDVIVAGGRWEAGAAISFPFPSEANSRGRAGSFRGARGTSPPDPGFAPGP